MVANVAAGDGRAHSKTSFVLMPQPQPAPGKMSLLKLFVGGVGGGTGSAQVNFPRHVSSMAFKRVTSMEDLTFLFS